MGINPYIRFGDPLSPREYETVALMTQGFSNKEIQGKLYVGVWTIRQYIAQAKVKLGARSTYHLVAIMARDVMK